MVHNNCLICKIRSGVQEERIKSSAQGNGLEILALDKEYCLMKFKGNLDRSKVDGFTTRLRIRFFFLMYGFLVKRGVSDYSRKPEVWSFYQNKF